MLSYYGTNLSSGRIMKLVKSNRAGTKIENILRVLRRHGLKAEAKVMTLKELKWYMNKGIPVILLLQAWPSRTGIDWHSEWRYSHYVVAIGYDSNNIYFADPYAIHRDFLTFNELIKRWHGLNPGGRRNIDLGIAVYGKKPHFEPYKIMRMR